MRRRCLAPTARHLILGDAVDMRNPDIAYDGVHLIASGNDTIASGLVAPVLEAAR